MTVIHRIAAIAVSSTVALGAAWGINPATAAEDDSYPEREVQIVIPYSAGGATDVIFRLIAQEAEEYLGAPIVPINMAGAGATRGSRHVKDADPDGYTLLGSHDTIALSNLAGMVDYSYDAFEPVALLTQTVTIPTANPNHPVKKASEIADYVRENPGEVRFSMTPSSTDHFFWVQFFDAAGIDMNNVRFVGYPGTSDQVAALMAEEIDFGAFDMPSSEAHYRSGSLQPLGVAQSERLASLPDTPTLQEMGIDLEVMLSRGIFAPEGTPQARIDKIAEAFGRALQDEELKARIRDELGSTVRFIDGEEYEKFLAENEAQLAKAAENIDFDS